MSELPRWGIVSTMKAPLRDILGFAAWHLELGAHRLYLYLDAPHPEARQILKRHPKIRVTVTNKAYWEKKGRRPVKHQPRQTVNAADAYGKKVEVDWLAHIDVDEFLAPEPSLPEQLAELPDSCLCARIRPVEALSWNGAPQAPRPFKSFTLDRALRRRQTQTLYPRFGAHLNGGFLSHVAGKMIFRTGLDGFYAKLHNVYQNEVENPGQQELTETSLLHLHGHNWDIWRDQFAYRHAKGAYRPEVAAAPAGKTMHTLLEDIVETHGEAGLHIFWQEVCESSDALLSGLQANGLLQWHTLNLPPLIAKHFPAP